MHLAWCLSLTHTQGPEKLNFQLLEAKTPPLVAPNKTTQSSFVAFPFQNPISDLNPTLDSNPTRNQEAHPCLGS